MKVVILRLKKEAHKGGEATTTKRAVCEVCGAEYGDLKQKDPKPADKTTESKKMIQNQQKSQIRKL